MNLLSLMAVAIPVTIIDIKHHRIPDNITFPAMLLLVFIRILVFDEAFLTVLILPTAGFLTFFLIWYVSRGRMGLGDAKLSGFLALVLGLDKWLVMVFLSSFAAVIFALVTLKSGKMKRDDRIPFGPFLCFGALLAMFVFI